MKHPRILTFGAMLLLAGASGAALINLPGWTPSARAADETTAEKVGRLLADLTSEQEAVRERAERDLVAMGDAGRAELERIARDTDAGRAKAAMKILASPRWEDAKPSVKPGEQRLRKMDAGGDEKSADAASGSESQARDRLRILLADSERRIAEIQRQFDAMARQADRSAAQGTQQFEMGAPGTSQSGSISMNGSLFKWDIAADGKVKITTKEGDQPEKTVEAESIEKLRADHPELAKRLESENGQVRIRAWSGTDMPHFDWHELDLDGLKNQLPRDTGRDADARAADAMAGPKLGISWEPVSDVLRDQLDLPEGGMVVQFIAPGSLAERLALRRNDVLLKIGDRAIREVSDVRAALEAVKDGDKVTVEVVRKSHHETLSATR